MIFYTCILINGDGIEKNEKEAKRYLKLVGEIDETYLDINVNTFIHSNKKRFIFTTNDSKLIEFQIIKYF